jgi:hypothetical protein
MIGYALNLSILGLLKTVEITGFLELKFKSKTSFGLPKRQILLKVGG